MPSEVKQSEMFKAGAEKPSLPLHGEQSGIQVVFMNISTFEMGTGKGRVK